eukprot:PhM_4_TR18763/c1_g1_i4/m.4298
MYTQPPLSTYSFNKNRNSIKMRKYSSQYQLCFSSILWMLLILIVLFLHLVRSAAAEDVLFAQMAAFTGPWTPGPRYNAGILAAFKEVNDLGGIYGRSRTGTSW